MSVRLKFVGGLRVFFRSFFVQASWNYERMLNLGFLFAIYPALKEIYNKSEKLKDSLQRHIQFFNAHPYMTSYALGSIIKLEEESEQNKKSNEATINRLRKALCTPLGSIGDQFFWALWRPLCGIIGIILVYVWHPVGAVIIYLIVYNIPHFFIRYWGLYVSYQKGLEVVKEFSKPTFRVLTKRASQIAAFVFGFFPVVMFSQNSQGELLIPLSLFIGSALISYFMIRWIPVSLTVVILMIVTYVVALL